MNSPYPLFKIKRGGLSRERIFPLFVKEGVGGVL